MIVSDLHLKKSVILCSAKTVWTIFQSTKQQSSFLVLAARSIRNTMNEAVASLEKSTAWKCFVCSAKPSVVAILNDTISTSSAKF